MGANTARADLAIGPTSRGAASVDQASAGSDGHGTTPMVSIVIPTYNRARLVEQAVASVLAQRFRDYEVLVVDDGSTDETVQRLERFGSQITVLRQPCRERGAARNAGIRASRGSLIAFLDSDDLWAPGKLTDDIERLQQDPGIGLVYCGVELIDEVGRSLGIPTSPSWEGSVCEQLLLSNFIPNSSVIVRRACLEAVGGFSEDRELSGSEDWELWLRIAAQFPVGAIRRPNVRRRVHGANTLGNAQHMERSTLRAWVLIRENPALMVRCRGWAHKSEAAVYRQIAIGYCASRQMAAAREWLRRAARRDPSQRLSLLWLAPYLKSWLPMGLVDRSRA